jgi:hypothetical protein
VSASWIRKRAALRLGTPNPGRLRSPIRLMARIAARDPVIEALAPSEASPGNPRARAHGKAPQTRRSGGVAGRLLDGHAEDEPDRAGSVWIGIAAVVLPRQPGVERAADVLLYFRDAAAQLDVVVRVL